MASMLTICLATLLMGASSHPNYLECGTDASTRLRVGKTIMQSTVEDAPSDSPINVEVQGSTVTVSSQPGITFAAKAFGEGATLSISPSSSASLQPTKDCYNQVYTVNGKSATYTFTHSKAASIVVGYHKPGWIPFAPGKVYLVTVKVPPMPPTPPTPKPTPGPTPAPGQKASWAVIVAGSSGYSNYRHQADACHAYQIMKAKGIPESNIILMAVDDIAHNDMNPFPGKVFNKPTADGVPGKDVYDGCKIDYKGLDVTPENFVKVLTGTGSGKVLKSTSADNVFVNFVDHGGVGIIGFPRTVMHKSELTGALQTMKDKDMFNRLVFYLEACESGSMFAGMNIPGVYGLTASNGQESSWGTYCMPQDKVNGQHIGSCLGDLFSVNWMEDLDLETGVGETLEKQYTLVQRETTKSHVQQLGDLSFTSERISDFVGMGAGLGHSLPLADNATKVPVSVRELHLHNLYHTYQLASTSAKRLAAGLALKAQLEAQQAAEDTFRRIAELSYPEDKEKQMAVRRLRESPGNPECEKGTHLAVRKSCAGKFDAASGFALQFQQVIVNICADVQRGLHLDLPAIARKACGDDTTIVV